MVAREFESMFASTMIRAMRKTVGNDPLVPQSTGEKMYTEMLDDHYARLLSENGGLGLAKQILDELGEDDTSLDELTNLKQLGRGVSLGSYGYGPPAKSSVSADQLYTNVGPWQDLITEMSGKYNLDPDLVAAVIARESSGNPHAVSRAGAKGLMQLMDTTAKEMGTRDSFDPAQNVRGGARYLRTMLDRFKGDIRKALASYNSGPSAVERHNGVPPYKETIEYVDAVMNLKTAFSRLRSRDTAGDEQ